MRLVAAHTAHDMSDPYVVFRIKEALFSLSGRDIRSIQKFPEKLVDVPNAPAYVRGSFQNQGEVISVVDLRELFAWPTIAGEYQVFCEMVEQRKQDHIQWMETLKSCRREGRPFPLATDPHLCKLGMWRDHYHSESAAVNHLLSRIDTPHKELHELARTVMEQETDDTGRQRSGELMEHMEGRLVPEILGTLDEMERMFQSMEYREMVLILRGEDTLGLAVDEVLGVEPLAEEPAGGAILTMEGRSYIRGFQRRDSGDLVMEVDLPALRSSVSRELAPAAPV